MKMGVFLILLQSCCPRPPVFRRGNNVGDAYQSWIVGCHHNSIATAEALTAAIVIFIPGFFFLT